MVGNKDITALVLYLSKNAGAISPESGTAVCVYNSYLILPANPVAKATADSSILRIVIALSGANLDFATSREQ